MKHWLLVLFLLGPSIFASAAWAADVPLAFGGERPTKRVKSFKELRQEGVVLQQLDYSCGAAAMATLLTSFFEDAVTEDQVIGFIFIHGQTPEEGLKRYFRRKGFSLLDLKRFAQFRGYKAAGYKDMTLQDLMEQIVHDKTPVLVPIKPYGYNHFVIVRAIQENRVFLADPAIGHTTMTIARFRDIWVDGIGFVVSKQPEAKRRATPSDEELAEITAAGAPSLVASPLPASSSPSVPAIRGHEPIPDLPRLRSVIDRSASALIPRLSQTLSTPDRNQILSIFELQRLNPSIQLGRPAGNFIDFSPPAGQPLRVAP